MTLRSAKSMAVLKPDISSSTNNNASAAPTTSSGGERSSDSSYRVYIRCRPFLPNDKDPTDESAFPLPPFEIREGKECVFIDPTTGMPKERFLFDGAFCSITPDMWQRIPELAGMPAESSFFPPVETQEMMYKHCAEPVVPWVLDGYNASILAYGQTSSGKTHTMMGSPNDEGIIPRLAKDLLQGAERAKIRNAELMSLPPDQRQKRILELTKANGEDVSGFQLVDFTMDVAFFEIYNENVLDLLQDVPSNAAPNTVHRKRKVRSHPSLGVYIDGLTYATVTTWEQCDVLLAKGVEHRHVAATKMNATSSRSHAVMQFRMTQTEMSELGPLQKRSNVYLADLAGSERIKATQVEGQQLKEAAQINKSLTTLRRVIDALISNRKSEMVPYRDSLLTWVLSDALGGNARSAMIATLCPNPLYAEESFNTLQYASRAKSIVSNVVKNEDQMAQMIRSLQDAIAKEQGAAMASINAGMPAGPTAEQVAEMRAKEERLLAMEKESDEIKSSLLTAQADLSALQERVTKEIRDKTRAEEDNKVLHKRAVDLSDEVEELRSQLADSLDRRQAQKTHIDKLELEIARLLEEKSTLHQRLRQEAAAAYMPMLRWYHGALSNLEASWLQPKRSALTGGVVTAAVEFVKGQQADCTASNQRIASLSSEIEQLSRRCSDQDATIASLAKTYIDVKDFLRLQPGSTKSTPIAGAPRGSNNPLIAGSLPASNASARDLLSVFHNFASQCASNPEIHKFAAGHAAPPASSSHHAPVSTSTPHRAAVPTPNNVVPSPTPLQTSPSLNLVSPWRAASNVSSLHDRKLGAPHANPQRRPVSAGSQAANATTTPVQADDIIRELRKKYPLTQQHGDETPSHPSQHPLHGGRWPGASLTHVDILLYSAPKEYGRGSALAPPSYTTGASLPGQSYSPSVASSNTRSQSGRQATSPPHEEIDVSPATVVPKRNPPRDDDSVISFSPNLVSLANNGTPLEKTLPSSTDESAAAQRAHNELRAYITRVGNDIPLLESGTYSESLQSEEVVYAKAKDRKDNLLPGSGASSLENGTASTNQKDKHKKEKDKADKRAKKEKGSTKNLTSDGGDDGGTTRQEDEKHAEVSAVVPAGREEVSGKKRDKSDKKEKSEKREKTEKKEKSEKKGKKEKSEKKERNEKSS